MATKTKSKANTTKKSSSSKKSVSNSLFKEIKKDTKKQVKKASKTPGGKIAIALFSILAVAAAIFYFAVPLDILHGYTINEYVQERQNVQKDNGHEEIKFDGTIYDEFQVHFLELGDWKTGDAVYIKAGNNDILIDAGSCYASAGAIENYVDKYCKDGKLEYVIATHAHEDHIAGFSGGSKKDGIFYKYDIGTIIEFAKTDSSAEVYKNYVTARDYAVSKGAKCYTALQAYNDTTLREISLGEGMKMTTLYQKYYEEKASTENNYSVCTLFTYNEQHYLFTGDLESAGETSLVEKNNLPKCELYKAGHHGSKTSSSKKLMAAIQPKVVCCCCCAGSNEYTSKDANQFPTQEFIDRVAPYTDNVYATTISTDNKERKYASLNGTILFSSNGLKYSVVCSNNNTLIKDTDWFKAHRTWPNA